MITLHDFALYAWANLCDAIEAREAGQRREARLRFRVAKDFARKARKDGAQ